jgi:pyruvate ferredoxin oxidoreductase gamma subunit
MKEVRIHGRGGQGAVTTAQLLAIAAFYDNKKSQAFPRFGVERRGAPVESFTRIDDKEIRLRSEVYNPETVIVLDPSLLLAVDVTEGLKEEGNLIINTKMSAEEIKVAGKAKIFTVDATSIALEIFGKPIVNTAMIGAYAAVTDDVTVDSIHKAIDQEFKGKIAEKNKEIVSKVYEETKKNGG